MKYGIHSIDCKHKRYQLCNHIMLLNISTHLNNIIIGFKYYFLSWFDNVFIKKIKKSLKLCIFKKIRRYLKMNECKSNIKPVIINI